MRKGKFDAEQIRNGALAPLMQGIAAAHQATNQNQDDTGLVLGRKLFNLKQECRTAADFWEVVPTVCPLKQSQMRFLLSIGSGKKTPQQARAEVAARQRRFQERRERDIAEKLAAMSSLSQVVVQRWASTSDAEKAEFFETSNKLQREFNTTWL